MNMPELELGDGSPENFHYLNQSGINIHVVHPCTYSPSMYNRIHAGCTTFDGDANSDQRDFNVLCDAFETLNVSKTEMVRYKPTPRFMLDQKY